MAMEYKKIGYALLRYGLPKQQFLLGTCDSVQCNSIIGKCF